MRNQTRWPVSQAHLPAARDRMHRAKHRHILHLWQRTSQITRDTRGTSKWDDQGSSGETCTLISADFPQDHWGGEIEAHGRQAPSSHGRRITKWTRDEVKTMTIAGRAFGLCLSKRCRRDQILGRVVRGGKFSLLYTFPFDTSQKPTHIPLTMLARRSLLAARTFAAPLRQRTPLFLSARNLSTATAPLSQSTSTTTQYTQPEAAEPEFDLAGRREKWYHIMRTRQGELPVYAKYRNDGGCKTIVRKIEVSFL